MGGDDAAAQRPAYQCQPRPAAAGPSQTEPRQPGGGLTARGDPAAPSARSSSAAKIKRLRPDQKAGDPGATVAMAPRERKYTGRCWDCRLLLVWLP